MKIYLDQSDLSNLALGRIRKELSERFLRLVSESTIAPVFSMVHIYETWKHQDLQARKKIALFADSLSSIAWILSRNVLIDKEVERAFYLFCKYPASPLSVVKGRLKDILYEGMNGAFEIIPEICGFAEAVDNFGGDRSSPDKWQSLESSWPSVRTLSNALFCDLGKKAALANHEAEFEAYVKEKLPVRFPNGNFSTVKQRSDFLLRRPWCLYDEMPTTYLMFHLERAFPRDPTQGAKPSGLTDIVHTCALPYVDMFLCDGQTEHYLKALDLPTPEGQKVYTSLENALSSF